MDRNPAYRRPMPLGIAPRTEVLGEELPTFRYERADLRTNGGSHRQGLQHLAQGQHPLNSYGQSSYASSPTPPPQSSVPALGNRRIFLPPRNIYSQQVEGGNTSNCAQDHFNVAQNLHKGIQMHRPTPVSTVASSQYHGTDPRCPNTMLYQRQSDQNEISPLSRIAEGMLLDIPLPRRQVHAQHSLPGHGNLFQNLQASKLNLLHKQQVTPPFSSSILKPQSCCVNGQTNSSEEYMYNPRSGQELPSSSPMTRQASSPTERISHRREANRKSSFEQYSEEDFEYEQEQPTRLSQTYQPSSATRPQKAITLAHAPPLAQGIQLVSTHELSDKCRQVFPYELFNAVQSKCFGPIYKTNDNVVVSAPTGSGKTALLELAICKLVEGYKSGDFKIVYQAPTKSLCSERLRDWEKKFAHLNLPVAELTGDTNQREMAKVRSASIIVTTPEKWDSITRNWSDHHRLIQMVRLFLIDEVHILKDIRGATLEAVVSRMKSIGADIRFIALSATVPNSHDIALWLGKDHTNQHLPAHRETFSEEFRTYSSPNLKPSYPEYTQADALTKGPVKLQKHVLGFDGGMNDFAFDKVLDGKLANTIQKYTHKKPIMVFCFTKKSCENTAALLAEWWTRQRVVDRAWPAPTSKLNVSLKSLQELVGCGVAFHHAGLDPSDRHLVETGYISGNINLICCTSTLAVGVNLPCHLVILKGTVGFQNGTLTEYSDLEVMQMLGRAGRPQFDDTAVAIILTRSNRADRYKKMVSGQDILESTLHLNLIEHLNSEIGLKTVSDISGAQRWLLGTFLSVRMRQNPNYYKIEGVPETRDADHRLEMVCERDIKLLQEYQLVTDGSRLDCTAYGEAMSRYMVKFETMKLLLSIPKKAKMGIILNTLCQAAEFKDLRMKPAERPPLREYNKSPLMKYAVQETVTTTAHKVSIIVQVQLSGIEDPPGKDFNVVRRQFQTDKSIIFDRIKRLVRCVIDCKVHDCDAVTVRNALDLARSLGAGFWEHSPLQLRQLANVGPVAVRKLANAGINSVEKLSSMATGDIERHMSKNPPWGRKILDNIANFPTLKVEAEILSRTTKPSTTPKVAIRVTLSYTNPKTPVWNGFKPSLVFFAESSDGVLVYIWRGNISKLDNGHEIKFTAELSSPVVEIKCHIACEEIVGTMRSKTLKHDIPATAFPTPKKDESELKNSFRNTLEVEDSDEFGDDIDDNDLIAATKKVEELKEGEVRDEYDSDDFVDIDNLESQNPQTTEKTQGTEVFKSTQMANGKWTCNHVCRDNKPLKNGQHCKHKCCKDGLDKPRRARSKSTISVPAEEAQVGKDLKLQDNPSQKKIARKLSQEKVKCREGGPRNKQNKLKLKRNLTFDDDLDVSIEVVNLADTSLPTAYVDLVPRDYRKLHAHHNSVQMDKPIKIPKGGSQISNTDNQHSKPAFLRSTPDLELFDDGGIDDEDLPSLSRLFEEDQSVFSEFDAVVSENGEINRGDYYLDESFHEFEDTSGFYNSDTLPEQTTPAANSSFANDVFDFDAFDAQSSSVKEIEPVDRVARISELPSPPFVELRKRKRSPEPELKDKEAKLPRVSRTPANESSPSSSLPSWVHDFDPELIEGLLGIVEFVD